MEPPDTLLILSDNEDEGSDVDSSEQLRSSGEEGGTEGGRERVNRDAGWDGGVDMGRGDRFGGRDMPKSEGDEWQHAKEGFVEKLRHVIPTPTHRPQGIHTHPPDGGKPFPDPHPPAGLRPGTSSGLSPGRPGTLSGSPLGHRNGTTPLAKRPSTSESPENSQRDPSHGSLSTGGIVTSEHHGLAPGAPPGPQGYLSSSRPIIDTYKGGRLGASGALTSRQIMPDSHRWMPGSTLYSSRPVTSDFHGTRPGTSISNRPVSSLRLHDYCWADTPPLSARNKVAECHVKRRPISCKLTLEFPIVAIENESELLVPRKVQGTDEFDWKRNAELKKAGGKNGWKGKKEQNLILSMQGAPKLADQPARVANAKSGKPPEWLVDGDLRVGPEAGDENNIMHVLPDTKRLYCNLHLSALASDDRVTYSWIGPEGARYHSRTMRKRMGQRSTWSWNYVHIAGYQAQNMPGEWSVRVSVNGSVISEVRFELLKGVVEFQRGMLPIILTCHSGRKVLPEFRERHHWQGPECGAEEGLQLARVLSAHLTVLFGERPSLIVNVSARCTGMIMNVSVCAALEFEGKTSRATKVAPHCVRVCFIPPLSVCVSNRGAQACWKRLASDRV